MSEPPSLTDRSQGKAARNERRKAAATTVNAISVALFVAAIIQPFVIGTATLPVTFGAVFLFVATQAIVHYILRGVED